MNTKQLVLATLLGLSSTAALATTQADGDAGRAAIAHRLAAIAPTSNGLMLRNGLTPNGLQLNGLHLNGLQLNGLQLNGLQLNGLRLNGLHLNGLHLNGLHVNGLHVNGLGLNGLGLNGLPRGHLSRPAERIAGRPDGYSGLRLLASTALAK